MGALKELNAMKQQLEKVQNFFIDLNGWKDWQYIVIHHSASRDNEFDNWSGLKKYHTAYVVDGYIVTKKRYDKLYSNERHRHWFKPPWDDIGYHFGIEDIEGSYVIQPGRDFKTAGAHAGIRNRSRFFNEYGIGICVLGNFDKAAPNPKAMELTAFLCKNIMDVFNIPKHRVIGHRDVYTHFGMQQQKTCPGIRFDMDKLRNII